MATNSLFKLLKQPLESAYRKISGAPDANSYLDDVATVGGYLQEQVQPGIDYLANAPLPKAIGSVIANPSPQELGQQVANVGGAFSEAAQQYVDDFSQAPFVGAMTAYHGTPHKIVGGFKKEAIGSGEGAQAFGHGFYATESKGIAEGYADKLTDKIYKKGGVELRGWGEVLREFYKPGRKINMDGFGEMEVVNFDGGMDRVMVKNKRGTEFVFPSKSLDTSKIDDFLKNEGWDIKKGRVYTLDIPEPDVMLDWDKPASTIPPKIIDKIEEIGVPIRQENLFIVKQDPLIPGTWGVYHKSAGNFGSGFKTKEEAEALIPEIMKRVEPDGRKVYAGLTAKLGSPEKASEYLYSLGIKGINYPAGSISGAKSSARNFVIFEPEDIKITAEEFLDK